MKDSDVHAYHRPREFAKRVNELYIFFNAILTMCIVFANVSNCIDTFPDELYNLIIIIIIIMVY